MLRVPVYRWTLPEDVGPLEAALSEILDGRARVVLFTNAAQVENLFGLASGMGMKDRLRESLSKAAVGSIGPTCTEVMAAFELRPDFEPEIHKMGMLVHEAARCAPEILNLKSRPAEVETIHVREGVPAGAMPGKELWFDSLLMRACRLEPVDIDLAHVD